MSRKRTGLRNKYRTGKSTYCTMKKARNKDTYGKYSSGKISDIVAGRAFTYEVAKGSAE